MEEIARVYAEALFGSAKDAGVLDDVHEQLGQVADALSTDQDLKVFFFSPYFSSEEKREGISKAISGADPRLVSFLELLAERHRMPAIFRIRRRLDELWAAENRQLQVTVTSAVALDESVADEVGKAIERQTGQTIELSSEVDPEILGGIVLKVGNNVLDASIRSRLNRLRKEVAKAT